jgi:hypothetical protein
MFKKNEIYSYPDIEKFVNIKGYAMENLGNNIIGEDFIVLRDPDEDIVISFVLTGANDLDYVYECIYSDLS